MKHTQFSIRNRSCGGVTVACRSSGSTSYLTLGRGGRPEYQIGG